jgi:hypothetical protein
MIVLFTGMVRSGSTWAFNIARVLLLAKNPAQRGEYRDDIGAALAAADDTVAHHLIKTHAPDPVGRGLIKRGLCRTICTYRDPLDCIASHMEAFGAPFEDALAAVRDGLALLHTQAAAGGVLFVAYADIVEWPRDTVGAIARYLDCAVGPAAVERIAEHFSKDNVARFTARFKAHAVGMVGGPEAWDSVTLFYSDHIRAHPTTAEALLSPEQRERALARLGGFVDPRGQLADVLVRRLAPPSAAAGAGAGGRRSDAR